jgi:anti-sigma factor RsiW
MGIAPNPICDRVRSQVSVELDGELSQLERAMVAWHLERCPTCAAFSANAVALTDALRSAPLEALERPLAVPSLRRRAYAEVRSGAIRAAAAAVGVAVILSIGLSNSGRLGSDAQSEPAAHGAYLQSMDYERQLMRQQIDRSNGTHMNVAI